MNQKIFILLITYIIIASNNYVGSFVILILSLISIPFYNKDRININKYLLILLFIITLSIIITFFSQGIHSLIYFLLEFKILFLFLFPRFFLLLLKNYNIFNLILQFSKVFIVILFCVELFGLILLDKVRYTGILGLSIYLSYVLILLLFYYYNSFKFFYKILIFINIALLGSKMGFLLYFITIMLKQMNFKRKALMLMFFPLFFVLFYYYALVFRGQDLFTYENMDRFLLFSATINYIKDNFYFLNYLFGYGIGKELINFQTSNPAFNNWFIDHFTQGNVYPYALHNEFFRLFFDFGIIGFLIILVYLKRNGIPILLVTIAMLTNSVFFSNELIFFFSLFIAQNIYLKKEKTK